MITTEEYNRLSVRITQEEAKVAALTAENERLKDAQRAAANTFKELTEANRQVCAERDEHERARKQMEALGLHSLQTKFDTKAENRKLQDENIKLRELLAVAYSGVEKLYADDGELQDSSTQPFIDYRNDTVDDISKKMGTRAIAALSAKLADEMEPATLAWEAAQEQDCEKAIKEQDDE